MRKFLADVVEWLIIISIFCIFVIVVNHFDKTRKEKSKQRRQTIRQEYKYLKPQKVKVCVSRGARICNYDEFLKNKDILEVIRRENAL